MTNLKEIDEARQLLKEVGFFVDNLWTVYDVMDRYDCTVEQAQEILNKSLTNEATMEQIHFSIQEFAEIEGLKKTTD